MKNLKLLFVVLLTGITCISAYAENSRFGTDFSDYDKAELVQMLKMSPKNLMQKTGVEYCESVTDMQQKLPSPAQRLQYHKVLNGIMGNYGGLLLELGKKAPEHSADLAQIADFAATLLQLQAPFDEEAKDDFASFTLSVEEVFKYQKDGLELMHDVILAAINQLGLENKDEL